MQMTLDDLFRPMPDNPRTISKEAAKGLGESLKRFGDISGLVWNKRMNCLICGHQRVKALSETYGDRLSVWVEDGEYWIGVKGEIKWHIRVVDWDIEDAYLANITANNPYLMGEYEDEGLRTILEKLYASSADDFKAVLLDILMMESRIELEEIGTGEIEGGDEDNKERGDERPQIRRIVFQGIPLRKIDEAKEKISKCLATKGVKAEVRIE